MTPLAALAWLAIAALTIGVALFAWVAFHAARITLAHARHAKAHGGYVELDGVDPKQVDRELRGRNSR